MIKHVYELNQLIESFGFTQKYADDENNEYRFEKDIKHDDKFYTIELYVKNNFDKDPVEINLISFSCIKETQNRELLLDIKTTADKITRDYIEDYLLAAQSKLGIEK